MRKLLLFCMAMMATAAVSAQLQEAHLGNLRRVGSFDWYPSCCVSSGLGQMQLSPDGKNVLYAARVNSADYEKFMLGTGERPPERWKWEVSTLGGGTYRLEMPDFDDLRPLAPFLAGSAFSPDSKTLALPFGIDRNKDGISHVGEETMQLALWKFNKGNVITKPEPLISAGLVIPMYAPSGNQLLIATGSPGQLDLQIALIDFQAAKQEPRQLTIRGIPGPPAPKGSVVPVLVPQKGVSGEQSLMALVLWDYLADRKIADVTTDPSLAASVPTVWDSGGRFLAYSVRTASRGYQTRIWDRVGNSVVATLTDTLPVGPVPLPGTFVVDSLSELPYSGGTYTSHGVKLYNIQARRGWYLDDAFPEVITARAGKVIFSRREEEAEFEIRCYDILTSGKPDR